MSKTDKSIKIEQTGSPIRRHHTQRDAFSVQNAGVFQHRFDGMAERVAEIQ